MIRRIVTTLFSAAAIVPSLAAADVTGVRVALPEVTEWEQVTDVSRDGQHVRQWIPEGKNAEDTPWVITEQKMLVAPDTTAETVITTLFSRSRQVCTDTRFAGPIEVKGAGVTSFSGRIMCAKQKATPYGSFTDQRVIVDKRYAWIVTSELRTPPSEEAGRLGFQAGDQAGAQAFADLAANSERFVTEAIAICTDDDNTQC